MKFSKSLIPRIFLILSINQIFFNTPKAQSAEKIKIIYSIFSRTVTVDSLKTFAKNGNSSKSLRKTTMCTNNSRFLYANSKMSNISIYGQNKRKIIPGEHLDQ